MFFQAVFVQRVIHMRLNLVQFPDLKAIDSHSALLGDSGVIVAGAFSAQELGEFNKLKASFKTRFFSCRALEKKDPSEFQRARKLYDFIAVRGSSPELVAWAAEQGADIVLEPFSSEKNFLDTGSATLLRGNSISVAFLLSDFLSAGGMRQAQLLKNASMSARIAQSSGLNVLLFSGAKSVQGMRAAKDLSSFGAMLGMKKDFAINAVRRNPEKLLERLK